jgi:5-methylcytosine-specific restriction endonuclease McrA
MPTSSINGPRSLGRTGTKYLTARKQVLDHNQICWLCGELIDMELKWPHPMYGTVDHIIPVKDLARDDPRLWDPKNLKPAHLSCNARRARQGARTAVEHPTSRNWRE